MSLKQAICSTPVLKVPYFTQLFVLECDASGTGLGEMLTQQERPLDFTNKQLSDRHLGKYRYEKEIQQLTTTYDVHPILQRLTCQAIP